MPHHTQCRICRSPLGQPFLDLGRAPLANAFPKSPAEFAGEPTYPLAVVACPSCGLVQLNYTVPAEQLYREYIYVSSTSEGVRRHAETLAGNLTGRFGWGPSDLLVEIASNDGTVLKAFALRGVRVLGVEPATNIAALAQRDGVPTVNDFFCKEVAAALAAKHGPVSGILGRHVFAHIDDLHGCLDGVASLLAKQGVLIIEVPYLGDLLDKLEFDTVYHEHLSYFSLDPVQTLCERHDLRLIDVERVGLHGGSVILYIQRADSGATPTARLEQMRREEQARQLAAPSTLAGFAERVALWKVQCETLIADLRRKGGRLVGYGAAAKANTLLNYCPEIAGALTVILDRSPHKQGRYTPGTHLPVRAAEEWKDVGASHMVILAWNFQDEIIRQMWPFVEQGGRFVQVLPTPREITPV